MLCVGREHWLTLSSDQSSRSSSSYRCGSHLPSYIDCLTWQDRQESFPRLMRIFAGSLTHPCIFHQPRTAAVWERMNLSGQAHLYLSPISVPVLITSDRAAGAGMKHHKCTYFCLACFANNCCFLFVIVEGVVGRVLYYLCHDWRHFRSCSVPSTSLYLIYCPGLINNVLLLWQQKVTFQTGGHKQSVEILMFQHDFTWMLGGFVYRF